jgi:hypothetical protein
MDEYLSLVALHVIHKHKVSVDTGNVNGVEE